MLLTDEMSAVEQQPQEKLSKSALCLWQHYSFQLSALSFGAYRHCVYPRLLVHLPDSFPQGSLQSDRLGVSCLPPSAEVYLSVPHPFRP